MYVNYYHVIGHISSLMHRPQPSTVQTMKRWVNMQWTRSEQRASRERPMGELALNEQQTCGESIASLQTTTVWRRSRYGICRSGPDDGMQRTTSFGWGEHALRHLTETYCNLANICSVFKIQSWNIVDWLRSLWNMSRSGILSYTRGLGNKGLITPIVLGTAGDSAIEG